MAQGAGDVAPCALAPGAPGLFQGLNGRLSTDSGSGYRKPTQSRLQGFFFGGGFLIIRIVQWAPKPYSNY